jgi:sulfur carrier protein
VLTLSFAYCDLNTRENSVLDVIVNGESRSIAKPASVLKLIQDMDLQGKRIAIEVNGEIVPASMHSSVHLTNGDNVEIVGAIGGG